MNDYDSDSDLSDASTSIETSVLLGYASKEPIGDPFNQLGGTPTWLDPAQHCPPSLIQCKTCNSYMTLLLQLNGDLPFRNGITQFLGHERRLYIWACRRKACRRKPGSVRAIRAVRVSKTLEEQDKKQIEDEKPRRDIGSSLFGGGQAGGGVSTDGNSNSNPFAAPNSTGSSNPFASSSTSSNPFAASSNPFAASTQTAPSKPTTDTIATLPETFASKARISAPSNSSQPPSGSSAADDTASWPPTTSLPSPYPTYALDADYERLAPSTSVTSSSMNANHAAFLDSHPDADLANTDTATSSRNKDDLSDSAHDRTFQHFADTLAQNPEQVLRYEFGGAALLASRSDAVGVLLHAPAGGKARGMPKCEGCGAGRVFELQMTPQAIVELEMEAENGEEGLEGGRESGSGKMQTDLSEGMEWQAIILGVCERDCGISGEEQGTGRVRYVEEWCGVQWEELVSRGGGR